MHPAGTPTPMPDPAGGQAISRAAAAWALGVLTTLNFLNYVDRYVLAAVLPLVHADPAFAHTTSGQLGLLQTSFLISYMLLSPLGGALGNRVPRKYIVAGGVAVWSLATVWSGLARSYAELLVARALIGCGEAGYAAVAPAIISDLFSPNRRARMLAVFYTATPAGSALGYVIGGALAARYGWRSPFFVAGAPGLLFALAALATTEPPRGAQERTIQRGDESPLPVELSSTGPLPPLGADGEEHRSSFTISLSLLRNPKWVYATVGFTLFTFTLGGLAYWTPTFFYEVRGLDVGRAGTLFGGMTALAGLLGTAAGGILGDAWARTDSGAYMKLSGIGLLAGLPFAIAAPLVPGLAPSLALFFVAELLVFLNTGPLNAALIGSVGPREREIAVGLNILFIHLLGDAISPPLMGALHDALVGRGMAVPAARTFALAASAVPLLFGGLALCYGARYFRHVDV